MPLPPALYKVFETADAFLAIMPRPRPGDWLIDEMVGFERLGVNCLVSLLERDEEADLILEHEATLAARHGIEFVSFPIRDRTVPADVGAFRTLVAGLARRVRNGSNVAVHCRAGIGRSGITVAATLVALGVGHTEVFRLISAARGVAVPDTDEQVHWFGEHWQSFVSDRSDA